MISINRPSKLNALNSEALIELSDCWNMLKHDNSLWVSILTSEGDRSFCVGMDIEDDPSRYGKENYLDRVLRISPRYNAINKPTVCAIKGYCLGIGWWLVMECDLRIASTGATLGIPENRLNISPIFGGLLTDHLPPGIALELLLTGDPLVAKGHFVTIGETYGASQRGGRL